MLKARQTIYGNNLCGRHKGNRHRNITSINLLSKRMSSHHEQFPFQRRSE